MMKARIYEMCSSKKSAVFFDNLANKGLISSKDPTKEKIREIQSYDFSLGNGYLLFTLITCIFLYEEKQILHVFIYI